MALSKNSLLSLFCNYPRARRSSLSLPTAFCSLATALCTVFLWASSGLAQAGIPADQAFNQAAAALKEGRLNEAAVGFEALTRSSPNFAGAHYNLGLVREEQGRLEEAIASFKKALALNPRLPGANMFLGIAYYRLNQYQPSIAALRLETKRNSSDANAWMWLGLAQLAAENPEEAAAALDKAAMLAPDNVDILYHRGRAHLLISKESYERMFQSDPNSWRVHQVLAEADAEADRHEDAIAEYEAAIQLVPQQPGLHEKLGTEYLKAGKTELAEAMLNKELEIDPNNVLARYKLGTLQVVEHGEGAKSKELIQGALRQDPAIKDSAYYLGLAEMELGNYDAAVDAFHRAITASDTDPEIVQQGWYQLGISYRHLHRIDDAQKAFTIFQRLKDEEAQKLQERLKKRREAAGQGVAPTAPQNPQ